MNATHFPVKLLFQHLLFIDKFQVGLCIPWQFTWLCSVHVNVPCQWLLAYYCGQPPSKFGVKQQVTSTLVCTLMGDCCGMSISADSPSDKTLNGGPLALLLRRQYEFPFGINIVQFSFFLSSACFKSAFGCLQAFLAIKKMKIALY